MADNNIPQLPQIAPDDYVELKMVQCRGCGETSDWILLERDEHGKMKDHPALWHHEHIKEHGDTHAKFYEYTLTRCNGETWTPGHYRPPKPNR